MTYARHFLKQRVEQVLSSSTAGRMARYRVRGKRLILAYHGIVPEGGTPTGERALFLPQRDFAAHLDMLSALADVAPIERIDEGGDGRPRVAITFDDAYRGAVKEGVEELVKRGLPATIFVAPGRLNGHVFWWDSLSAGRVALDETLRHHALHALAGRDERVRAWAADLNLPHSDTLPQYARSATRAELGSALGFPGITVGSHTWSHANLTALSPPEMAAELARSREWLRAEFGEKAISWLAYPYGLDSPQVHRAAADASYSGAVRIDGGWHRASDVSPFARPRLNIPAGLSPEGFRARLLGSMIA